MYALIEKHANPREVYVKYLLDHDEEDAQEMAKEMEKKFWADLQERLDEVKQNPLPYTYQPPELEWKKLRRATIEDFDNSPTTAISEESFKTIFDSMMKWPDDFNGKGRTTERLQECSAAANGQSRRESAGRITFLPLCMRVHCAGICFLVLCISAQLS